MCTWTVSNTAASSGHKSGVLLPEESTVAVMETLVAVHTLVLDVASGVNCWVDRLLIFSGDDRDRHKGSAVVIWTDSWSRMWGCRRLSLKLCFQKKS